MFDFTKALKECKILYCEDRDDIRKTFSIMLKGKADNIMYAEDGEIGLQMYNENMPDMIITDVEMPNKDGLEMIYEIRKTNPDIPIMITTSREDQGCMLDSIDIGVDKFIVKPVRKDMLLLSLHKMLKSLDDKRMADEYEKEKELLRIKKNTKDIITQLTGTFTEPIMILQYERVKYINKAFEEFFGAKNIESLYEDSNFIDTLLEKKDGYCASVKEFSLDTPDENKIYTNINNTKKVFQVVKKNLLFDGDKYESSIYVFQDITTLEYQKLKIENYSFRLEQYLIDSKYKVTAEKDIAQMKDEALSISKDEQLDKDYVYKINAKDLTNSLNSSIKDVFDKLKNVEVELDDNIYDFLGEPSVQLLQSISSRIDQYAFVIKSLEEFDDLAQALFSTRDILSNVSDIDSKKTEKIRKFLGEIIDSLKSWRKAIAASEDPSNISELKKSLFNSCLQMELILTGVK